MEAMQIEQSYLVNCSRGQQLHVRRVSNNPQGPVVVLLHGLMENGTIFQSRSRQGLAYYLAGEGYDAYIPDLRGRGCSWPQLQAFSRYSTIHAITEDLPAILGLLRDLRGVAPQFWVGHGWGGVLINSFLARYPEYMRQACGLIYFGSHRQTQSSIALKKNLAGRLIAKVKGFVPATFWPVGVNSEYQGLFTDFQRWAAGAPWVDPADGFDYGLALTQIGGHAPALYFANSAKSEHGWVGDVRVFMREQGTHDGRLIPLGLVAGNVRNYTHIEMLSSPEAVHEVFPFMINWMAEKSSTDLDLSKAPPMETMVQSTAESQSAE